MPAVNPAADTEPLELVLERLESSLRVDLIATYDLTCCSPGDRARDILASDSLHVFDQFPVREGESIVGVLERNSAVPGATIRECMTPLRDELLVSASVGILSYIGVARASSYHLVVREHRIAGIVTPSDLLKLPARVVLFTLITHLESTMAAAIRSACEGDTWLTFMSDGRRAKLEDEYRKLKEARREPDKLLLTQFCDKREILAKGVIPSPQRRRFVDELKELEGLRDDVMHSNDYLPHADGLNTLIVSARRWMGELRGETEVTTDRLQSSL